jgi:hypothetical protein
MTTNGGIKQMIEEPRKTICIIDGHGGGIGAANIKYIRQFHENRFKLVALGTNAIATAGMLKAGAVMESPAPKILLPLHRENVHLMHFSDKEPLPHQAMAIAETKIMEVLHHV